MQNKKQIEIMLINVLTSHPLHIMVTDGSLEIFFMKTIKLLYN